MTFSEVQMWIDRLVEVTHWEPLQAEMSWSATEERLGLSLPEDYKRLAAVFGKGLFSDFLQILSVAPGGPSTSPLPGRVSVLTLLPRVTTRCTRHTGCIGPAKWG